MKRLLVVLPILAAACSSGSPSVVADFRGPSAAAAFLGAAPGTTGLQWWVAVSSSRGNELKIVNPADDSVVRAANLSFALSVPVLERPTNLASGSLHDGKSDALVVASSGTVIQLVGTWYTALDRTPVLAVASQWDLSTLVEPGAQILALTVAPVPDGQPAGDPPVYPVVSGKAWVVAAFSGGSSGSGGTLAVLQIARQSDGSIALDDQGGGPAVALKPLGFDPSAIAVAPDNFHLYLATADPIPTSGGFVLGVGEVDMSGGLAAAWPVRGLDGHAPTSSVAAAIVSERSAANWWDFQAPVLRVYASLGPTGCGPRAAINCGVATFDPALGGLAADPAPDTGSVPRQSYRAPMMPQVSAFALAVGPPPANPAPIAPGNGQGSQVCWAPTPTEGGLPLCPDAVANNALIGPFNAGGVPQRFLPIYSGSLWWTPGVGLLSGGDGYVYVLDLGRYGTPSAYSALTDTVWGTLTSNAVLATPTGPTPGTGSLGFPAGTAAVGLRNSSGTVDNTSVDMVNDVSLWPGFTRTEAWSVVYQSVLPGLALRRAVLGLGADGQTLYLALQEAYAPPPAGVLAADVPWVPVATVADPQLAIHPFDPFGAPPDIAQFALDVDPCTPTRPNWVPAGGGAPVYDPTEQPQRHEAPIGSFLPPDPALYPAGALALAPPSDATLASEYACLVAALQARPGTVLTAFRTIAPAIGEFLSGAWIRGGGFVAVGSDTGYAGRPVLGAPFTFAWAGEDPSLSPEALILSRKARRHWYPAYYETCKTVGCYPKFPQMGDPMAPGPVISFTVAQFCETGLTPTDCDPLRSLPARDAGVLLTVQGGLTPTARRPYNASVGTSTTSFDKSLIPGLEWRGRVFYTTFAGNALFDVPPGLDMGQVQTVR